MQIAGAELMRRFQQRVDKLSGVGFGGRIQGRQLFLDRIERRFRSHGRSFPQKTKIVPSHLGASIFTLTSFPPRVYTRGGKLPRMNTWLESGLTSFGPFHCGLAPVVSGVVLCGPRADADDDSGPPNGPNRKSSPLTN